MSWDVGYMNGGKLSNQTDYFLKKNKETNKIPLQEALKSRCDWKREGGSHPLYQLNNVHLDDSNDTIMQI